jgi:hypothetical protein
VCDDTDKRLGIILVCFFDRFSLGLLIPFFWVNTPRWGLLEYAYLFTIAI